MITNFVLFDYIYETYAFFLSLFIFREKERVWMWVGRAEREGEKENPSRLHATNVETDVGLYPMNSEIMTWAEIKSQTLNWQRHPGAPETYT